MDGSEEKLVEVSRQDVTKHDHGHVAATEHHRHNQDHPREEGVVVVGRESLEAGNLAERRGEHEEHEGRRYDGADHGDGLRGPYPQAAQIQDVGLSDERHDLPATTEPEPLPGRLIGVSARRVLIAYAAAGVLQEDVVQGGLATERSVMGMPF